MQQAKVTAPRTSLALFLVGSLLLVAAIDRDQILVVIGALFIAGGMLVFSVDLIVREIRVVNRPADDAFSEGYEAGYDRGWRDGSDQARPALVGLVGGANVGAGVADSCDTAPQRGAGRASSL